MGCRALDELSRLDWTAWPTRYVLFTGKGGVGKTTTASGAAVALASSGVGTLLISTDPASNLDDVFGLAVTDPVCGMKVDREKAVTKQVAGETYYFCSTGCLHAFEADPEKYMHESAPAGHGHAASSHH